MRKKRVLRIRKKIIGTSAVPRLTVHRSHGGLTVQVIDDQVGKTLVAYSTKGKNKEVAHSAGAEIAARCKKRGVNKVVFDRAGQKYHGAIQALAEAARTAGLQF